MYFSYVIILRKLIFKHYYDLFYNFVIVGAIIIIKKKTSVVLFDDSFTSHLQDNRFNNKKKSRENDDTKPILCITTKCFSVNNAIFLLSNCKAKLSPSRNTSKVTEKKKKYYPPEFHFYLTTKVIANISIYLYIYIYIYIYIYKENQSKLINKYKIINAIVEVISIK
eukprot:gene5628-4045_t